MVWSSSLVWNEVLHELFLSIFLNNFLVTFSAIPTWLVIPGNWAVLADAIYRKVCTDGIFQLFKKYIFSMGHVWPPAQSRYFTVANPAYFVLEFLCHFLPSLTLAANQYCNKLYYFIHTLNPVFLVSEKLLWTQ